MFVNYLQFVKMLLLFKTSHIDYSEVITFCTGNFNHGKLIIICSLGNILPSYDGFTLHWIMICQL